MLSTINNLPGSWQITSAASGRRRDLFPATASRGARITGAEHDQTQQAEG
jgi:hypothetical protein